MTTDSTPLQLPTLDRLGITEPLEDVSAADIGKAWFSEFSKAILSNDTALASDLFLDGGFWKDILAFTWDFRTFHGKPKIKHLLDVRLGEIGVSALTLSEEPFRAPALQRPYPDLALLRLCFDFTTKYGKASAVLNLVPLPGLIWKAYTLFTCLDSLHDFPEQVGPLRDHVADHGTWKDRLNQKIDFVDTTPTVVVIGAGHVGLEVAARLQYMGVPTLVVDRKPRIGDNWRDRYRTLCLHDPVWYCHTPYLKFPTSWPVYTPSLKLADWLESYANFLELNVWTSSTVQSASWNKQEKTWTVEISRKGKANRTFTIKHLVFATGFGGGIPITPEIPGKEHYKGTAVHSSGFTSAADYVGKKAIVVGACNSGHDLAQDFCNHGVDITMYQRSSTFVVSVKAVGKGILGAYYKEGFPVDTADHLSSAFPNAVVKLLHQRMVPSVANTTDKDILEGLAKVGFKTNLGPDGAGVTQLLFQRAGGYYLDTGTSQHIIDGHIKIKNGSSIENFTEHGLRFADGTELQADVIVFATGFGDPRDVVRDICGSEVASQITQVWGFDEEGQVPGVWRQCGHDGIWFGIGNFALSRFHSTHLALQIKAIEEGLLNRSKIGL
ncbi:hypothetical protein SERLA73DRAFT_87605 [Serpula lacrymans var. lacrymans S7.3]|uniref:FAD/NAD(P)-binding domain-containing protein n=2 Tax=Serpula lacrymans var. lacrymans TaxID=341189 RepID=F8PRL9_SERL3|nr:uncharacterized protein SERLADRAFT_355441 [Serpula lacrymans var. lacrymans S7.9]EGO01158.1 hypothetical protein SERLA73DRAFT_87605 [Serpula lacrymans var. lacrymans S7.3]EGO26809.1 hypothetical protein SERLADRAFT_355441 [Serpula lacrymans var. lacrymans S7.9]